ncbi:MAG: hypothetical protein QM534_16040 [Sediminibacterium sp.]|nr:hypothetical protein [Sediminibacterium sp.]
MALLFISVATLVLSVPKTYVHALLGHHHELSSVNSDKVQLSEHRNADCDFDTFNTPVFFDVIEFNGEVKEQYPQNNESFNQYHYLYSNPHFIATALRGPPQI